MTFNIVIPIYNEETILEHNCRQLSDFIKKHPALAEQNCQIILADNASTDQTPHICQKISSQNPRFKYLRIEKKGKGQAVLTAWRKFTADINIFMDADLSTDINSLPELIKQIQDNNYDIVLGSRFHPNSQVRKSSWRKLLSSLNGRLIKHSFKLRVLDTPCGFKAVNKKIVYDIVPKIKNKAWFFDTELLVLASQNNCTICEIPIKWQENNLRKSKVNVYKVASEYIKEIKTLKTRLKKEKKPYQG